MRHQLDSHVIGAPLVVFIAPGIHPTAPQLAAGDFDIDDGCHRAVAMAAEGIEKVEAFIGELQRGWPG